MEGEGEEVGELAQRRGGPARTVGNLSGRARRELDASLQPVQSYTAEHKLLRDDVVRFSSSRRLSLP